MAHSSGTALTARQKKHRSFMRRVRKHWMHLLMILPVMAWYILFKYGPLYGVLIAFEDFKMRRGILGSPFVGLQNFRFLFSNPEFFHVFSNTVIIALLNFAFGFPAPIIMALMLNELRAMKFKRVTQTISYLPHFISWVILTGIFMEVLSPTRGPINGLIRALGGTPIFFLGDPKYFRATLVVTNIWKGIGWGSIVYLAALGGVNEELYDAARVDGCGPFKRILHVTLPGIVPVITIMLIMSVGSLVDDNFDQVFNLMNDAVRPVGDVLGTFIYRQGVMEGNFSNSTAVELFRNMISLVLVVSANFVAKRVNEYGLW